jgi:hypothetical protein
VARFTRRALLRRGALGGLALAVAPALAQALPGRPTLARGVALGPGGFGVEQSYAANRQRFIDTGTPWIRLWADWPRLQPAPGRPPDFSALDADVALAKADGMRVMVTAWRFPLWANGTAAVDEATFALTDRGDPAHRKDLTFGLAADLSPAGAWGRWIDTLLARYSGRVDALEIVNEPNYQLWPQSGIDSAVATMMQTAATLAGQRPGAPLLVGPATADVVGDSPLQTGYDTFTTAVLRRLAERGFRPGPSFAWSHHDYTDVEEDRAGAHNGVARVRARLEGNWAGWPRGDVADPGILITESGARVTEMAKRFGVADPAAARMLQAQAIERSLRRLLSGPEGNGVAMLCQYLFVTDANYDSGLCELDGTPRPAYYAWGRSPTSR